MYVSACMHKMSIETSNY